MCSNCTTAFDVAATNAVLVSVYATNQWERLRDSMRSKSSLQRELETWEANAEFMRTMGHEPLAVLGAAPTLTGESLSATDNPSTEQLISTTK